VMGQTEATMTRLLVKLRWTEGGALLLLSFFLFSL